MDAAAWLAVAPHEARRHLGDTPTAVRRAFKALAAAWHPDASTDPQASAVFAHIVALRDAALKGTPAAKTQGRPKRVLRTADGRQLATDPVSTFATDTCEVLVGRKTIAFLYAPGLEDMANAARAAWSNLRTADDRMEKAFRPTAPTPAGMDIGLKDGGHMLTIARPKGFVALRDLLIHLGGSMHPHHVAWVGSGLLNHVSWFQWMGLAHGAIGLDTVFVDPTTHAVTVLGGWECATRLGERPRALPEATLRALPRLEAAGQTVDAATDPVLVREVLRALLGQPAALRPVGPDIPDAFGAAFTHPPHATAPAEYRAWIEAVEKAWGPRQFRVLDTDEGRIYGV
jgi:hypothetical protein